MNARALAANLVLCSALSAQALPSWWTALPALPRLESRFVQESQSEVFGVMKKGGLLQVAMGGRIRVAYDEGLLVVGDGLSLIQFDPRTRTAQRFDLKAMMLELPLIRILVDPRSLKEAYHAKAAGSKVVLTPRREGLPTVEVEGAGQFPTRISWMDGTGARQALVLVSPRTPGPFASDLFRFKAPEDTRWIR
ncbi:MAG: outer membrane lipoprotein carrier protein LolA [Firmicutes bacterium]|nr:outer membrane lipoprotein carrier protein LolA [Bacillota bacterium]